MRQTRVQYPGATLGGQAGHYPTPVVKGMSYGVVRKNSLYEKKSVGFWSTECPATSLGKTNPLAIPGSWLPSRESGLPLQGMMEHL